MPPIDPTHRRDRIVRALYRALDTVNETLPPEGHLMPTETERILGKEAKLDSLGFAVLMVAVESSITMEFGDCPSLAEELTSIEDSTITIGTIADFLDLKL